jgi:putative acyl-CoA dehydrogenase
MCDVFLVLAHAPEGLSCFLVERGPGFEIQRLKDKLGTRSLASSEIEFRGARGRLVGPEGRGVATIIEMVTHTRLDCLLGTAAGMRRAVAEAVHHARHRSAFGGLLVEQPAMRNVLADLALESEAATATALRVARAYDEGDDATPFRRVATAVAKYWVCKRGAPLAVEAIECLGGNGYVEESPMPTIYRDIQINSTWEGSGNVMALDVLRAMAKDPSAAASFVEECELAAGENAVLDDHLAAVRRDLEDVAAPGTEPQWGARRLVERLGVAFQASLLVRSAPPAVADAFCGSRLGEERGRAFGTLPRGIDAEPILERALAV